MNLEQIVAVSGNVNGIFKVMATKGNGLIITDMDSGKHKFASHRLNDFTHIESVGIYIDDNNTIPLPEVFEEMLKQLETNPPISHNAKPDELMAYFATIVPNYDRDKVLPRDVKKAIKWFSFLNERNYLTIDAEAKDTENQDAEDQNDDSVILEEEIAKEEE
jgi:hypothetical protein